MSSSQPVILLLGAGVNTGLAVAKKFHSAGWKVACVARSEKAEFKPYQALFVQADFANPSSVEAAFKEVEEKVGIPNVINYNAYSATFGQIAGDLFAEVSVEAYAKDLQVNSVSNFAAIKLAIAGFKKLPSDAIKTYIYTGNMCSSLVLAEGMTLGVGKNASLYTIEAAAAAYGKLAQFYFADERDVDGGSTMHKINGEAHAEAFWELAQDKQQGPINYTFVKGKKGYTRFEIDTPSRKVANVADLMKSAEEHASS